MLAKAGARQVMIEYDASSLPVGVAFAVETPQGTRTFLLPVAARQVEAVLKRQRVAPRYRTPEQAHRVAWRIVKDWLEAQLAIIQTEMVTLPQVMLPYLRTGDGRTMYELYVDSALNGPLALTVGAADA